MPLATEKRIVTNTYIPVIYRYRRKPNESKILMKDDSNTVEYSRAEIDDPISSLLDVINRLIDIEGKTEYQNDEIQDIQNSLSSIINLLNRSKR